MSGLQPAGNADFATPQSAAPVDVAERIQIMDVLRGVANERIGQLGHDRLSTYGIGAELDARQWKGVFRQLVAMGLLEVDIEGHGALRLTAASRPVLKGEQAVALREEAPRRRERERSRRGGDPAPTPLAGADQPLFEALRALRAQLAREQSVPETDPPELHEAVLRLRGIYREQLARLTPAPSVASTRASTPAATPAAPAAPTYAPFDDPSPASKPPVSTAPAPAPPRPADPAQPKARITLFWRCADRAVLLLNGATVEAEEYPCGNGQQLVVEVGKRRAVRVRVR